MKKIVLIVVVILVSLFANAQITVKQIGKVHYSIFAGNEALKLRNDSIAAQVNDYVTKHAPKKFPDVLLYLYDQEPQSNLSNFEQVLVYYQKYEGEFFHKYDNVFVYKKAHIGIDIALFENHGIKAISAIKYAIDNFKKLKKNEKRLSKKGDALIDEDLETFKME